ncbi:hypothetical protein [Soonwooa purpurea]
MDPITLTILLGFKLTEEAMVKLGYTEDTALQPLKYGNSNTGNMTLYTEINKDVIDELVNFLMVYEGYEPIARQVKGESFATGGYGSISIWSPQGVRLRAVKNGDKFSREEAYNQILYYFKQSNFIDNFNIYLKTSNIAVPKGLLVSLLNACYMGGVGLFKQTWFKNCLIFADKNTNYLTVAEKFKTLYINELKSYKSTKNSCSNSPTGKLYHCYGLGWTRRVMACVDAIQGVYRPKSWYDKNIKTRL